MMRAMIRTMVRRSAARALGTALAVLIPVAIAGCETDKPPTLEPLAGPLATAGPLPLGSAATSRVNGSVGAPEALPAPAISYGTEAAVSVRGPAGTVGGGDVSLDFADTDIREVVAQILGTLLHLNYTIDPAVRGTATLRTAAPLARGQLIPVLETLLTQNGATLVQSGALYRVVPATAPSAGVIAGSDVTAGGAVVALRYASAEDLARVLQPFAGTAGRVLPDPGRNALIVSGDPTMRESLIELIRAFDIDVLAGQSYALLPVGTGDAKDFATALQSAFRSQNGAALAGLVRVIPMDRMNAVLVITSQPRYLDDARRVFALVDRNRRDTVRAWHVYYLQNGNSNDVAYTLQQAFTPGNVTAQGGGGQGGAQPAGLVAPSGRSTLGGGSGGGIGGGGLGGSLSGGGAISGLTTAGALNGAGAGATAPAPSGGSGPGGSAGAANPLLGGLDQSAGGAGGDAGANTMRIIPNPQNNALMIYATGREEDTIEAMLRKIDVLPLQVRIDATIAEVTLNDALQYGTQFFFRSGGINGALNNISAANTTPASAPIGNITSLPLGTSFPGFIIGGGGAGGAPFALSLLQSVTTVNVLSSPQILVLDNQAARLQVGALVPYLTTSSQSTLTNNAPVINSIGYQPTGVIMQVTPRVNSGGLVTLDVAQEVSEVSTSPNTSGINSPTFNERNVTSRVVVQDGQTIGLAGLITDSVSKGNSGIPWLKDIPLLGVFAGTQNNARTRTELLVLITPHVLYDQRDARALTEDLREQLINAATVPDRLRSIAPSGSTDPNAPVRRFFNPAR